jgi:hypothetical protein
MRNKYCWEDKNDIGEMEDEGVGGLDLSDSG